ncbi:hypothetical protein HanRHA438_Chr12g0565411 [Helianthus annuus]|nr:hypothetical protein HanRHA438_Chr12g0565411 [Helianthus annuus]
MGDLKISELRQWGVGRLFGFNAGSSIPGWRWGWHYPFGVGIEPSVGRGAG